MGTKCQASEIDLKKGNGDSKKKSAGTSSGRNSRAGPGDMSSQYNCHGCLH